MRLSRKEGICLIRSSSVRSGILIGGSYTPDSIILASIGAAEEFADTLRALLESPEFAPHFAKMAGEELNTTNLEYGNYNQAGDHSQFLRHFAIMRGILTAQEPEPLVTLYYKRYVRNMPLELKAMSIASRERELSGIFQKILNAQEWEKLGYEFFAYYLRRHIELDSRAGGHADLLKRIHLEESGLMCFWTIRRQFYKLILTP